ncbi:hypothetical protein IF1G_00734 [Cordyceps javanica]|uniref:Uncharacterized protein n=1 Tax=Cordyceps javanica TaxID=43265 RepID=A0A545VGF3_9HYPO|nr:hypothetical protein IF1G_00734 [Cordyceps javanica]
MDTAGESALQYAERLGLFLGHRHHTFSPQSCLASLRSSISNISVDWKENEDLHDDIQFPSSIVAYDRELLASSAQNEPECVKQTNIQSEQDLLLELPDMGPGSSTDSEAYSNIMQIMPNNCLITQYLPLISVDEREDQGLCFPPHIDRLHQALLHKVTNECIEASKSFNPLKSGIKADPEVG